MLCDNTSRNDSSQGLPHFNQKELESVLLRNINCVNPNWLQSTQLIPKDHSQGPYVQSNQNTLLEFSAKTVSWDLTEHFYY